MENSLTRWNSFRTATISEALDRRGLTVQLDPEERLMDVIASELGFCRDFLPVAADGDISFDMIQRIQKEYCPNASRQANAT